MKAREQYIREFLFIAIEDLEVSRLLYKNEKFAHSIYFLQQSVEKTVKALAIDQYNLEPEKIVKIISHEIPVAVYIGISKLYERIIELGNFFTEIAGKKDEFTKMIKEQEEKEPILEELKKQKFKKIRNEFKKLSNELALLTSQEISSLFQISDMLEIQINLLIPYLSMVITSFFEEESYAEKEFVSEKITEFSSYVIDNSLKVSFLLLLALVTYCHVEYTRYPNEIISPKNYNENLGIVQSFELIATKLEESHDILRKYFK